MNKLFITACTLLGLVMAFMSFPDGAIAALFTAALAIAIIILIRRYSDEKDFLINVFLVALFARIGLGLFIYFFDLQLFFGPDATFYDELGGTLADIWHGVPIENNNATERALSTSDVGWGMHYLVGSIYFIAGKSILIAQSFCAVIGAATAPMTYFCALNVFNNKRVAKISALAIALFPSFIIWSSQLLKDGLIIFFLVCAMTMVLHLQKKFSTAAILVLIFSLFGIISLRFYIFYMVAVAVAGSFIIGLSNTAESMIRRVIVIAVIGLSLTYIGVLRNASSGLERYGSLEAIQRSRLHLATSAESGFGEDIDVSTTEGAITTIPIGFIYLMLAPFPWQVSNFRQGITLPENFFWWSLIPLLISGIWYTIRNRLRQALPVLIFTLMLSLAYSIFQGNVGTAYRQRTQIQVFLFMFIAVGWSLIQERKENRKIQMTNRRRQK